MAPISQIFAFTALAAFATAIPLKPRQPDMVTETQWTTVDVPVTLWVDENGTPLSTVASGGNFAVVPTLPSTPTTFSTATSAPAPSNAVPTVTSTSTAAPVSTQQPISAPAPPSSTAAPYVPPTSAAPTTTPAPAPPASSTVATPSSAQDNLGRQATTAAAAAGGSVSASSSNGCTGVGDACVGDITHYDGGLGACGWNVNTDSDMQIALPVGFMGSQSNGNPYCGKSLTIKNPNTGATVSATVGDKCMGCEGRSIDLTNALFNAIGGGCDGRCSGFEWWFN